MAPINRVYRAANDVNPPTRLNGGEGTSRSRNHHTGCRLMGRYRNFDHQANAQRDQCRNPLVKWACLGILAIESRDVVRALVVFHGEARVFLARSPSRGVFCDG